MWKIQLTMSISFVFIFFKRHDKERVMHSNSDNTKFMIYDNADEVKTFFSKFFLGVKLDWKHQ